MATIRARSNSQFRKVFNQEYSRHWPSFLEDVSPLPLSEYVERRNRLARALAIDGVDAFVVEPGYTFKYYANVSQPEWEVWEPEERPFLMVLQPAVDPIGTMFASTTFLVASFEVERARLLKMPFDDEIKLVTWEEDWNPYTTLLHANVFNKTNPTIMVGEEMRDFIQRGLGQNGFDVIGLSGEVEMVRQTKSGHEIDILRAVNTGTVEAIRQMRKCLVPGLTEEMVMNALDKTLKAAGLDPFFDIVLFDENASNPHGGTNGSKRLARETFVLIDVGAHLYGYSSDVCRTFFPPFLPQNNYVRKKLAHKLEVWNVVFEAQTASIFQFRENETAASVDIAARTVIADAGYGDHFPHRVGHGIGIKAHESPYLHKGNTESLLKAGMAFTSEPGVYLVGEFGVRHEDVFLVREDIESECLSCPRAADPWTP